jgi:hypothetical protein
VSKFVGKFQYRDYDEEYEVFDKKRKKEKPVRRQQYEYSKLRHDDESYYEKPSRSKARRAY